MQGFGDPLQALSGLQRGLSEGSYKGFNEGLKGPKLVGLW